jgi:hypothetical protein
MLSRFSSRSSLLLGAVSLAASATALAGPCTGPGAPTTTETKCLTAVAIPGNPIRSFDISWVNPHRAEYYLADRSNKGIDIIDTHSLMFKRTIGGFVGIVLNGAGTAVDNNHSGPDGVTSHGRWLYAGDGDSTLKVIDLNAPKGSEIKATIPTGGTTRVDEMALTADGELLLAANNAEDPPFATLFSANGDRSFNSTAILRRITGDPTIIPAGAGLSMEQPAWDPTTKRFYVSVPIIANNPPNCNFGQNPGAITCDGGLAVIDPTDGSTVVGAFNPATNTGIVPLHACGPNGASVGPHDNLVLGCTPANNPANVTTTVINATTKNFVNVGNITGSDEVWFNAGDGRYYTGSNRNCKVNGAPCPAAPQQAAVLGVIDAETNFLIETVPQGSGSHSVAADSKRNLIFVPQVAPVAAVGSGGDTTAVGAGICGTANDNTGTGCVGVYIHRVDHDGDDHDHDHGDHDHDH